MRPFVRLRETGETKRKRIGYPFTTFTDFSDFLGILLGVLSDDLATMSILLLDHRPNARGPLEVLVGIVLGELDSSTPRVSGTIEI